MLAEQGRSRKVMEMWLVATHFLHKEPPTWGPERPAPGWTQPRVCGSQPPGRGAAPFRLEHGVPVCQTASPPLGFTFCFPPGSPDLPLAVISHAGRFPTMCHDVPNVAAAFVLKSFLRVDSGVTGT